MADVICVDGTVLGIEPVPVVDRDGRTYEVTLRLTRGGMAFGAVGERCGFFLAALHGRLAHCRDEESPAWPDPDDRFPESSVEGGLRSWAADEGQDPEVLDRLERYLPRDRELFAFRYRDPDDLAATGELRCAIHTQKTWVAGPADEGSSRGHWRLARRAVVDAWGDAGVGARAVLTSGQLLTLLDALLEEFAAVGARYDPEEDGALMRRPAG
ncbi:MAG: hypothetical protein QOJ92_309 [Frankiales bacterium]|nr:hypothetical protein [Frankiales bacterium]MDX6273099.1 hypothetical protein [Frankiales bacterium]